MELFHFLLLVFGTICLIPMVLIVSYLWTQKRFNKLIKKHLLSRGFTVDKINRTKFRFTVKDTSLATTSSTTSKFVMHAGTGSGFHYRKVDARNRNEEQEEIYVAVEVLFFRPIDCHIFYTSS